MVISRDVVEKHKQQLEFLLNMSLKALSEATDLVSDASQQDISVSLLSMDLLPLETVRQDLTQFGPNMAYVRQRVTSSYASDLLFMLPQQQSVAFIESITQKDNKHLSELSDQEKKVFVEIGNIILNCFLRHFSQKFNEPVNSYIPVFNQAPSEKLLKQYVSENEKTGLFYIRLNIKFIQKEFPGYILWTDPGGLY